MSRGNSYVLGQALGNGQAMSNGPYAAAWMQGWDIRPASIWDHMEPRIPA